MLQLITMDRGTESAVVSCHKVFYGDFLMLEILKVIDLKYPIEKFINYITMILVQSVLSISYSSYLMGKIPFSHFRILGLFSVAVP